jgi:hypothetical protein
VRDSLHWMLGAIIPPSLAGAMQSETREEAQQRLRLLYVACTRAMDLLVLPELSWSDTAAWARAVDFRLNDVPVLDIAGFRRKPVARALEAPNLQTGDIFGTERSKLDAAFTSIAWVRPSDGDQDILKIETSSVVAWEQPIDTLVVVKGGSVRGTILHKLMEELITGELQPSPEAAQAAPASSSGNFCRLPLHRDWIRKKWRRRRCARLLCPTSATTGESSLPRCRCMDQSERVQTGSSAAELMPFGIWTDVRRSFLTERATPRRSQPPALPTPSNCVSTSTSSTLSVARSST